MDCRGCGADNSYILCIGCRAERRTPWSCPTVEGEINKRCWSLYHAGLEPVHRHGTLEAFVACQELDERNDPDLLLAYWLALYAQVQPGASTAWNQLATEINQLLIQSSPVASNYGRAMTLTAHFFHGLGLVFAK